MKPTQAACDGRVACNLSELQAPFGKTRRGRPSLVDSRKTETVWLKRRRVELCYKRVEVRGDRAQ